MKNHHNWRPPKGTIKKNQQELIKNKKLNQQNFSKTTCHNMDTLKTSNYVNKTLTD